MAFSDIAGKSLDVDDSTLRTIGLPVVAEICARETERFFHRQEYDPSYCYELFRRAIQEQDESVWGVIYDQYNPLVAGWVRRHPAFMDCGEEVQYIVNRAFERFWNAIGMARFQEFNDLASLLRYLQACVHSAIMHDLRNYERSDAERLAQTLEIKNPSGEADLEEEAATRQHRRNLWREIEFRLQDDKERKVVFGSYLLALKPRELVEHFGNTFDDVKEVYRIKENVLARLRRDEYLAAMFQDKVIS